MRKLGIAVLLFAAAVASAAFWARERGLLGVGDASAAAQVSVSSGIEPDPLGVSALGRLEPEDGMIRIAGPSTPVVVIGELLVDDGEQVEAGQALAVLDALPILEADVARLEAQLAYERAELRRSLDLNDSRIVSDAEREAAQTRVRVAQAELQRVRAELARHTVRAPFSGQVIRIHAHEGERVGEQGILELGRTDRMLAIAEVYETDIVRVRLGQRATISSPALAAPLTGRVERIRPQVAKQDALGTDPAARKDARVIEVEIRLDESAPAANLSYLQVSVEIDAD